MPVRPRAPGPESEALLEILARMRALGAEVRGIELRLASSPPAKHGPLVRRLDRLFAERETVMNEWIDDKLARIGASGVAAASSALGAGYKISALMARTIAEIQAMTFEEVAASTRFLSADARRFIRQIAKLQTELHATRGLAINESAKIVAARMRGAGIHAFIDKAGRAWRLETYSEMLVRTRTAEAYSHGTLLRSRELGVEVVEVFDGTEDDAACAEANGQFWTVAYAFDNEIEHPNCRRAFGPAPDFDGEVDAA